MTDTTTTETETDAETETETEPTTETDAETDDEFVAALNNPTRGNASADDDATPHDNDADSRPTVYGRLSVPDGEVEVSVEGAEHESIHDIADEFDEKLRQLVIAKRFFTGDMDTDDISPTFG